MRMYRLAAILAILASSTISGSVVPTHAADAGSEDAADQKVQDSASTPKPVPDKDPNIKIDLPKGDDPKAAVPNPKDPNNATRSQLTDVRVDNATPWHLHLYVNGAYQSTLGPWSHVDMPYTTGNVVLYSRVVFDNGTFSAWGPRHVYLHDGQLFSWNCAQ